MNREKQLESAKPGDGILSQRREDLIVESDSSIINQTSNYGGNHLRLQIYNIGNIVA